MSAEKFGLTQEPFPRAVRRVFRRRGRFFLAAWALGPVIAFAVSLFLSPVYEARAVIKVQPSSILPDPGLDRNGDIDSLINTEVKSVKNLKVLRAALATLGEPLDEAPDAERGRLLEAFSSRVESERMGRSTLILVSVEAGSAAKAAAAAHAVARAYIAEGTISRTRKAREVTEFTRQEMEKAESRLRASEDEMKAFAARTGAHGEAPALTRELSGLHSRLEAMGKDYTAQHPDVVALKAKADAVDAQLRKLPQEEVEFQRYAREIRINEELYSFLAKKYKEAQISEEESSRQVSIDIESEPAVPDKPVRPDFAWNMLWGGALGFLGALLALFGAEALDTSIGTLEEVESFTGLPVLAVVPHVRVSGGGLFSFLGGGGESLDETRARLVLYHPPQSPFAEAYHTLRTNLKLPLQPGRHPAPAVLFTSALASEGKTVTSLNFALTAAQSGFRTLFIEGDLRRSSAHDLLGMPAEPGLSDAVLGEASWMDVLRGTSDFLFGGLQVDDLLKLPGIENFRMLCCGTPPVNPADVLGAARFDRLLEEARSHFDLVVIDCAPVMLFADALLAGPKADALVLVHKPSRSARESLRRAKDQLLNVKARVSGVLLNDVHLSEMQSPY